MQQNIVNHQKISFSKSSQALLSLTPEQILSEEAKPTKRTKTVCTIGPKSQSVESAGQLVNEGMSVARLNFSHGTHQQHAITMGNVIQAAKAAGYENIGIMLDTKGPEIRTGVNQNDEPIKLKEGQLLEITTDYSHKGTNERIACSYADLTTSTAIDKKILIADGEITTKVKKIQNNIVTVEVLNDGNIGSKKNMCLPGTVISLPTIGSRDEIDIVDFGLKQKVNFIAVSFARQKHELIRLRNLLNEKDPEHGPYIQIISKIQNDEAFRNLDEIIEASDGIMVARGDLGMEVPLEKVVILQKYMTERAINAGRIVITATQMIQSMIEKPRPTRAEVADITNAVLDLTDANMTSGETANGKFPTQSARLLKIIAQQTQAICDYRKMFDNRKSSIKEKDAVAIIESSFELDCKFILIKTESVRLVHRLSTLRPKSYILVLSNNQAMKKAISLDFGVSAFSPQQCQDLKKFIQNNGSRYGIASKSTTKVLRVEVNGEKIEGYKIIEIELN